MSRLLESGLLRSPNKDVFVKLKDFNRRYYKHYSVFGVLLLIFSIIFLSRNSVEYEELIEEAPTTSSNSSSLFVFPTTVTAPPSNYDYSSLPTCDLTKEENEPRYNATLIAKFHKTCTGALSRRFLDNPKSLLYNWAYTQYVCDEEEYIAAIPLKSFSDEKKTYWALLPNCQEEHVLVTLGIRDSRKPEKLLKQALPNLKLYGTNPYSGNSDGYDKVFQVALGNEKNVDVMAKKITNDGKIESTKFASTDAKTFFNETLSLGVKKIDMMWINLENGDFNHWDALPNLGMLSQLGLTVCQINIEFDQEDPTKFSRLHAMMSRRGGFITMRPTVTSDSEVTSMFFLNVKDEYCVRKYLD